MASDTVILHGYQDLMRALRGAERGLARAVRNRLKQVAEPVAADVRAGVSVYPGASVGTIGPRVAARGVFVTQRRGKVTGEHPEFGALQMGIMVRALEDNEGEIVREVEDALDDLGRQHGF